VGKETRNDGLKKWFAKICSLLLSGLFLKQHFCFSAVFYDFEGENIPTAREDNSVKSTGHLTSISLLVENYSLLLHVFFCCPPECLLLTLGQPHLHKEQLSLRLPQALCTKLLRSGLCQQNWGLTSRPNPDLCVYRYLKNAESR